MSRHQHRIPTALALGVCQGCGEDAITIIATSSTVAVPIKHVRSNLLPQRYHVWNDQSPCSLLSQPIA